MYTSFFLRIFLVYMFCLNFFLIKASEKQVGKVSDVGDTTIVSAFRRNESKETKLESRKRRSFQSIASALIPVEQDVEVLKGLFSKQKEKTKFLEKRVQKLELLLTKLEGGRREKNSREDTLPADVLRMIKADEEKNNPDHQVKQRGGTSKKRKKKKKGKTKKEKLLEKYDVDDGSKTVEL